MKMRLELLVPACCALAIACGSSSTADNPVDLVPETGVDAAVEVAADVPAIDVDVRDATDDAEAAEAVAPDVADVTEAGDAADATETEVGVRGLMFNPLFGDTSPQNLLLDPNFSVRFGGGLGNWQPTTFNVMATTAPSYGSWPMSDAPAGIALPVAHLADGNGATTSIDLVLLAQVPGGPGPFHLRVWVSTLDPAASATLPDVAAAVLTSLTATATDVTEDPAKARVIGGRTWHLFDGIVSQDLTLGAYLAFEFPASKNTWLLQAPEFVPVALESPAKADAVVPRLFQFARTMTANERQAIIRYVRQPRLSVPPFHPAMSDPDDASR